MVLKKNVHGRNFVLINTVATFSNNWKTAVSRWYREIADCDWDLGRKEEAERNNLQCGHYSQLVWSNTSRVGCASTWCPDIRKWGYTGFNLVCNYGPGGNYQHMLPYKPASDEHDRCSMCPGRCKDGLCDCGGKVCYNGGSLSLDTCQCACGDLWRGETCEAKNCPPTDPELCGQPYPRGYPKDYCEQYHNVPETCPYMCGVCEGAACGGLKCHNHGKLDLTTCKCKCTKVFKGKDCGELNCPKRDSWFCGKTWDKSYCKKFFNAAYECPYMCNVCRK